MKIYTRAFNSALGQIKTVETEMTVSFRSAVATIADLPTSENSVGDVRVTLDTDHYFAYVGGTWVDQGVLDMGDLMQERLMQGLS
jgi:hypothetical protein